MLAENLAKVVSGKGLEAEKDRITTINKICRDEQRSMLVFKKKITQRGSKPNLNIKKCVHPLAFETFRDIQGSFLPPARRRQ